MEEELPEGTSAGVHMLAGALAGIVEHGATYPLDSIKTRMQVIGAPRGGMRAAAAMRNLYAGVGSVVVGAGPAHAVHVAAYERAKVALGAGANQRGDALRHGAAGAVATAAADAVMTPFDVVKQRMQMAPGRYGSVVRCALDVLRAEGLRAFYVSYPTTLLMNVPFHAVQFPVYEAVRRALSPGDYAPWVHIVAGGIAGGTAALLTTPVDVVKTTLQTAAAAGATGGAVPRGVRHAVRLLWTQAAIDRRRGAVSPGVLFRGAVPRTLTHVPSTALCWAVYEYFKHVLAVPS